MPSIQPEGRQELKPLDICDVSQSPGVSNPKEDLAASQTPFPNAREITEFVPESPVRLLWLPQPTGFLFPRNISIARSPGRQYLGSRLQALLGLRVWSLSSQATNYPWATAVSASFGKLCSTWARPSPHSDLKWHLLPHTPNETAQIQQASST